jgi:formylmethanofuran dehydrogenase subunit C
MTLVLEYTAQTTVPVEVEGLVPAAVRDKGLGKIERLPIVHGNRKPPLAEFFRVSGDPADERIELRGDLSGVHWIGAGMDRGEIRVLGPAGRHVGSEMSGGQITVEGDVSDWLGGQMRGGAIRVRGRAGHLVGAAYRGSPRGVTGGTILVEGPAGNEIGHSMRRGLIAVGGADDAVGFNMLAGTVLVFGPCGIRPGAGMRRGTIGLFSPERPALLPTFRYGCRLRPVFLAMLFDELARGGYPVPRQLLSAVFDLFHGDFVALGRGEVLLAS